MQNNFPSTRSFILFVTLLGTLTAVGPMSIDMYLPGFPALEAQLGDGAPLTLSSFFIGLALGQMIYGPLSDRFGRKKPLIIGLIVYIITSVWCAESTSIPMLIVQRFIQALGGCAGMVMARAIVRDRCDPRHTAQVFSMLMLVMGVAPILAPMLGGWILTISSWPGIFYMQTVYGVVCLLWVFWGLKESRDTTQAEPLAIGRVLRGYAGLLTERSFMGYALTGSLVMSGMFAYISGSPHLLMEHYRLDPVHYGWAFGVNALCMITAGQINARLLRRGVELTGLLRRASMGPAVVGVLLAMCTWLGWTPLWLMIAGFGAYMVCLGFVNPNAGALALAAHGQRAGLASALMGFLQFSLASCAGAVMDFWQDGTARPLASVMSVCGVLSWLAYRTLVKAVKK